MYFEPIKKTYYRFPSTNSIHDFDSRYYFPEKSSLTEVDARFEVPVSNHMPNRETFSDI